MQYFKNQKLQSRFPLISIMMLVLLLSSCSTTGSSKNDPLEPMNRAIFQFNEVVDDNIFEPVAKTYKYITPDPVETGVSNFFSNIGEVSTIANDVFQFKFKQAGYDFLRFSINTTIGVLGIFDVATSVGLKKNNEDFGQTLGYWGIPQGPYLVLPFFGASTFRDAPGLYADMQISPINQLDNEEELTLNALNAISTRARLLRATKILDTAAKDKYIFIRESYLQKRESMVNDGDSEEDFEIDVIGVDY
ncbi:MAG: VacJ family lipoprotein [Pseudomonadota bacterium]|nr:VacJ family lipoprotein [Pseudomonadota bacterium]